MGADGGTVPTRAEQIKQKQREGKLDRVSAAKLRLNFCAINGLPLAKSTHNLVCDSHGNLFNLESVLECLVDAKKKLSLAKQFGIRKMKDLIKLKAEMNPDYIERKDADTGFIPPFRCPFTKDPCNGVVKFIVLRKCGHVVSQHAMKQLADLDENEHTQTHHIIASNGPHAMSTPGDVSKTSNSTKKCMVCQTEYDPNTDEIELVKPYDLESFDETPDATSQNEKKRSHPTPHNGNIDTGCSGEEAPPDPKKPKLQ